MTKDDAYSIIDQLQQAHRLSVGFYRRLLPTLDLIASRFGCVFWSWAPLHTSRPGRSSSQPSKSWSWDYVPLYAFSHTYKKVGNDSHACPDDIGIKFEVYVEDSFSPDNRVQRGQPDPITMPKGSARINAYLYRPKLSVKTDFETLWEEEQEEDTVIGTWRSVSENWNGIELSWPLADIMFRTEEIVEEISDIINLTNGPAKP